VGVNTSTDAGTHLFAGGAGFIVANPTLTSACNAKLTITNVNGLGADITFNVASLNGTTQTLTLIGTANPLWTSAFGENNQGESLTLFWDATGGTYRLIEG
jgi:hypothetical protein